MRNVFLLLLLIMLGGCAVTRPPQPSVRDSTRVEVVERIERVTDTVFIEIPADHREQTVCDTISRLETSFAVSDAIIREDGRLYHSLENKPQNWQKEVVTEIVVRDSLVYKDRVVTEIVEVLAELSKWQRLKLDAFGPMLAIILIVAALFLGKTLR